MSLWDKIVCNLPLGSYKVKTTATADDEQIQHVASANLTIRMDEGATYTYIGAALPGADEADPVWTVKRLTNADSTLLFADGNDLPDNVWNYRASLNYE